MYNKQEEAQRLVVTKQAKAHHGPRRAAQGDEKEKATKRLIDQEHLRDPTQDNVNEMEKTP